MSKKELLEEIKENAREDRKRLSTLCDALVQLSKNEAVEIEEFTKVAVADSLTKITDALTKIDLRLLEAAKIELKRDLLTRKKDASGKEDIEEIFNEIQNDGPLDN